jgi:hypothetical protein
MKMVPAVLTALILAPGALSNAYADYTYIHLGLPWCFNDLGRQH